MTEFPSQAEFRQWLELSFAPAMVVANEWNCHTCPLAKFLSSRGAKNPAVFGNAGGWHPNDAQRQGGPLTTPDWANEFVYWADRRKTWLSDPDYLTAKDCFDILDSPRFDPDLWNGPVRGETWD
jgi:hypothetical protein